MPAGQRIYAIGDIHGRSDLLDLLMRRISADARTAARGLQHTLVFLGDYVDRGQDSAGVLERLSAGPPPGFGMVCLRGNHEAVMQRFLTDHSVGPAWLSFGGVETLASYGIRPRPDLDQERWLPIARSELARTLPQPHHAFLQGLRLHLRVGGYLFVHAGIRPGVKLERQKPEDLLWIRDAFLDSTARHGMTVVHGHTVVREPEVRPNRIGIDTGAYASGRLTCLVLEGTERRFLTT
ncbi:metallophosphoesterase family protein [Indioceanicola profundi]|uniref:metallophosphoesterase family protein n=1 Tax=Indioceanicola profundi TaxID=2220096 RepID=UPI000E6ABDD6|nr:metallophosphoesterase family protein [Indioceanicola profundi]